jgi:hypothetical protein
MTAPVQPGSAQLCVGGRSTQANPSESWYLRRIYSKFVSHCLSFFVYYRDEFHALSATLADSARIQRIQAGFAEAREPSKRTIIMWCDQPTLLRRPRACSKANSPGTLRQ